MSQRIQKYACKMHLLIIGCISRNPLTEKPSPNQPIMNNFKNQFQKNHGGFAK